MKNNKIVLSIVVSSLLFSQSYALPSGGKFTHGTSGSINVNGNTMNITGNKVNSVIQWGGGFNIAKNETVNFNGKNQNYLNIAYGTKSSTIDGLLNATGNNVYLINPNGVVIGKSGTINANKFGVSTSSMSNTEMQNFANSTNPVFSPVFKPNNKGNVINMGNIKAKDVLIVGNEVGNIGSNGVGNFNLQDNGKIQFVGDKVKVNVGSIKNAKDIIVSAQTAATLGQSTTDVYKNGSKFDDIKAKDYNNLTSIKEENIEKHGTIANVEDWAYFAKGINEGKTGMKSVDTFDLISDIDFGANCDSSGNCDPNRNYASFDVNNELQDVNMIVGTSKPFSKNFNGNGYTLKNIYIDTTTASINSIEIGLFGYVSGKNQTIKNLNIDYQGGGIKTNGGDIGGFIGWYVSGSNNTNGLVENIKISNIGYINVPKDTGISYVGSVAGIIHSNGTFKNIIVENIGNLYNGSKDQSGVNFSGGYTGGFAGSIDAYGPLYFKNISLSNIKNIQGEQAGGFAGNASSAIGSLGFSDIYLTNIENISNSIDGLYSGVGGFVGEGSGSFQNIILNNIGNINNNYGYAGGFIGYGSGSFQNIILNNIGNISGSKTVKKQENGAAGGFIGGKYTHISTPSFSNIYMFFNPNMQITSTTGKIGIFSGETMDNIYNIHIYKYKNDFTDPNKYVDKNFWNKIGIDDAGQDGKINIHTYDNSSKDEAYQAFLNKAGDITITPPETPSINPDNLDFTIEQTNNKISQNDIDKEVIDSILSDANVDSWINVNDNPTKIQVSQGNINSINQSFDFMEALGSNFINTYLKDSANDIANILQVKTNIQALIGNVNNLVNNYNDFQNTKEDLNKAIDAYNAYVALINQGAASSKDAEFISLKNKVNDLYAKAQGYLDANNFNKTLESYKTQASDYTKDLQGKFSIKGEFDTKLASLDSVLDKPNNEGGDTSNPEANAPLPFSEALLTQMDKSVLKQDEDDKEPTVDEASTQLSGNTCIVSDNFKAGNPCSR